jgi:hypothetical protein
VSLPFGRQEISNIVAYGWRFLLIRLHGFVEMTDCFYINVYLWNSSLYSQRHCESLGWFVGENEAI